MKHLAFIVLLIGLTACSSSQPQYLAPGPASATGSAGALKPKTTTMAPKKDTATIAAETEKRLRAHAECRLMADQAAQQWQLRGRELEGIVIRQRTMQMCLDAKGI